MLCGVLALVLPRAGFVVEVADAAGALGAIRRADSGDVLVVDGDLACVDQVVAAVQRRRARRTVMTDWRGPPGRTFRAADVRADAVVLKPYGISELIGALQPGEAHSRPLAPGRLS